MEEISDAMKSQVMKEIGRQGGLATARKPKAFLTWRATKASNARWEQKRLREEAERVELNKQPVTNHNEEDNGK
jgi:hypothetical protein